MSNRGFLAVLAAIAFVRLLGFGLIAKEGDAVEVGQPAPDASVELLDGTGEASLADFRGRWGTAATRQPTSSTWRRA